ncbi:MAG: glycosyltransferase [Frankiales bacterium]|nr:glycosyltransferase [Frankiales bacterium]
MTSLGKVPGVGGARRRAGRLREDAQDWWADRAPVAALRDAGAVDVAWYSALVGEDFRGEAAAARHWLHHGGPAGLPPHPLLEPSLVDKEGGKEAGTAAVLALLAGERSADLPHPVFDDAAWVAAHPEAAAVTGGPLVHFLQTARADTLLPVPEGYAGPAPAYGPWRERMLGVAREWAQRRTAGRTPDEPDWAAAEAALPARVEGRVSVVVTVREDWARVQETAAWLAGQDDVELVVLDDASSRLGAFLLEAVVGGLERVVLRHRVGKVGRQLALGHAVVASTGAVVVVLADHLAPLPGWTGPLLEALTDESVAGAQPLVVHPDGTVRSAGFVLPGGGGLPAYYLAEHPVSDVRRAGPVRVRALNGLALALRADDVVAVQGPDPAADGWAEVDLCLRIAEHRGGGAFAVVDTARVESHASRMFGRDRLRVGDPAVLRERWAEVLDRSDDALWDRLDLDVVGAEDETDPANAGSPGAFVPRPVLAHRVRRTADGVPRLRWSVRIASRSGPRGDTWGDTFFGHDLAAALERLGQHAGVDRRDAYTRRTAHLDEVTVTVRGLVDVTPSPGAVNLLWVISHPDLVTPEEVRRYDAAFAASIPWAAGMSEQAGVPVQPLLQATDPARFHPRPGPTSRVVFVGNHREDRRIVTDALAAGIDLDIYGRGWREAGLGDHVRAEFVPNDRLGELYAGADVVLCDHWADMAREGFAANRLFDAVASGTRVVSDDVAGAAEVFGPLVHVYRDRDDLAAVVGAARDEAFLADDERRARAAEFGVAHSFDARAATLLEHALRVRRDRGID